MKFIQKHTAGPLTHDSTPGVLDTKGLYICDTYPGYMAQPDEDIFNAKLFSQAPAMLDYLIERAEDLEEQIDLHARTRVFKSEHKKASSQKRQELSRLVEIIRAAGVEVVDE